jgi:hypothetical protein
MSKEQDRLLEDEEIKQYLNEYWDLYWEMWNSGEISESDYDAGWDYWTLEAQDAKTASIVRVKTLKEVGSWVEKRYEISTVRTWWVAALLEALKQGGTPEE